MHETRCSDDDVLVFSGDTGVVFEFRAEEELRGGAGKLRATVAPVATNNSIVLCAKITAGK